MRLRPACCRARGAGSCGPRAASPWATVRTLSHYRSQGVAPIRVEAPVNASHRTFAAPPALPYALGLGFSTCSRCPYEVSQRRAETTGKALVRVGTSVLMLGWATPNHRVVLAKNVNFKKK